MATIGQQSTGVLWSCKRPFKIVILLSKEKRTKQKPRTTPRKKVRFNKVSLTHLLPKSPECTLSPSLASFRRQKRPPSFGCLSYNSPKSHAHCQQFLELRQEGATKYTVVFTHTL
ncbi:unnamed protein product [Ectocarpus sp. 13 AM-2016]